MSHRVELEERESAYRNRLKSFAIKNLDHKDIVSFLNDAFTLFNTKIIQILQEQHIVKVGACFVTIIIKDEESAKLYIYCEYSTVGLDTNLSEWFKKRIVAEIKQRTEDFEVKGSGWTVDSIVELEVHTNQYDPIRGSAYMQLPRYLASKGAIINVDNTDIYCFKWAVLAARFPKQRNPQRHQIYRQHESELNFTGLEFPVRLDDIHKFEEKNPSISINVYMFDEHKSTIYPVRLTNGMYKENHIHLLLLSQVSGETIDGDIIRHSHYCWIKSLSRLLSSQVSKTKRAQYFCDRCLQHFSSQTRLNDHHAICMAHNNCKIEMPDKDNNIVCFKDYHKKLAVPFIIYADVEAILKTPTEIFCSSERTKAYQQHETYSIGFYFKCNYDSSLSFYESYRGPDCITWFVKALKELALNTISPRLRHIVPIEISEQEESAFQGSRDCHVCGERFKIDDIKVRDHCHLTGKYRGAAHKKCNLTYEVCKTCPVVFHNLSHYDAHFIIKEISTQFEGEISVIPVNDQNYISFTKTVNEAFVNSTNGGKIYKNRLKFRFIDSFRFMASSLDKLASYLPSDKKKILRTVFNNMDDNKRKLLERKGVFPYDYVDSWEKLNENRLPTIDQFYSKLTETEISKSDYEFAQEIWEKFDIKTLGEYSDLYLKTDILLLADVFENFRETSMKIYELDPAQYFTAPSYSWDAMLKFTKVRIELLTDIDMLMFIERGIRGGISQCSGRYSKANNKYMEDFDPSKPSSYLMYIDCNNLYG